MRTWISSQQKANKQRNAPLLLIIGWEHESAGIRRPTRNERLPCCWTSAENMNQQVTEGSKRKRKTPLLLNLYSLHDTTHTQGQKANRQQKEGSVVRSPSSWHWSSDNVSPTEARRLPISEFLILTSITWQENLPRDHTEYQTAAEGVQKTNLPWWR